MASYVKFQTFAGDLCSKVHDVVGTAGSTADTLKIYLSNAVPSVSADAVKADLAEITIANGYTGPVSTQNSGVASTGTVTLTGTNVTITASGGSIGPFQYVVLFNDTPTSPVDPLIAYWDLGSPITLANTEGITLKFNGGASSGTIFTLA